MQIHKRLSDKQVKLILWKYLDKEITAKQAQQYLDVKKSRFFEIIKNFKQNKENYSISYTREKSTNKINPAIEQHILNELKTEKETIIDNPIVPVKHYNYSYIQNLIHEKYQKNVSVPTIINRAKMHGFYKAKPPKRKHDREVITNYAWELIQHDSSHHLFAPNAKEKWYLITSIDDYSRALLYADLWLKESTWAHIQAAEILCSVYGFPLRYYADQHSIFRYVKDRDKNSIYKNYQNFTDDVNPQWKQVLLDCWLQVIYALSPQAKGKIERPYQWMQDHLVRSCLRNNVTSIEWAKEILRKEIYDYNYKRIHSTTWQIPMMRFEKALKENKSLFRPFEIPKPFESTRDIFALRMTRIVDTYRKISLQWIEIKVPNVEPKETVELRLYPDIKTGLIEIRFWHKNKLAGIQNIKKEELKSVRF